jgi:hypothetical protein
MMKIPHDPGTDLLVLVFTCDTCPIAQAYKDRIIAASKKFPEVGFVAVNSNFREGKVTGKYPFPYYYDRTQGLAASFGAQVTPHVYVLDKNRRVRYQGAVDDSETSPKVNYLEGAIKSLLDGKEPSPATTEAYGCRIQYKKLPRL